MGKPFKGKKKDSEDKDQISMTMNEFNERIDLSIKDSENDLLTEDNDLISEIQK